MLLALLPLRGAFLCIAAAAANMPAARWRHLNDMAATRLVRGHSRACQHALLPMDIPLLRLSFQHLALRETQNARRAAFSACFTTTCARA